MGDVERNGPEAQTAPRRRLELRRHRDFRRSIRLPDETPETNPTGVEFCTSVPRLRDTSASA